MIKLITAATDHIIRNLQNISTILCSYIRMSNFNHQINLSINKKGIFSAIVLHFIAPLTTDYLLTYLLNSTAVVLSTYLQKFANAIKFIIYVLRVFCPTYIYVWRLDNNSLFNATVRLTSLSEYHNVWHEVWSSTVFIWTDRWKYDSIYHICTQCAMW